MEIEERVKEFLEKADIERRLERVEQISSQNYNDIRSILDSLQQQIETVKNQQKQINSIIEDLRATAERAEKAYNTATESIKQSIEAYDTARTGYNNAVDAFNTSLDFLTEGYGKIADTGTKVANSWFLFSNAVRYSAALFGELNTKFKTRYDRITGYIDTLGQYINKIANWPIIYIVGIPVIDKIGDFIKTLINTLSALKAVTDELKYTFADLSSYFGHISSAEYTKRTRVSEVGNALVDERNVFQNMADRLAAMKKKEYI